MKLAVGLFVAALLQLANALAFADDPAPLPSFSETAEERDARMRWWREARFGMFIHWGLYAVPAKGEWHMAGGRVPMAEYQKHLTAFSCDKWDAEAVAALAEQAGMKYVVMTAKHHEGFAMWDTDVDSFNVVDATPCKRDVLREMKEACDRHGLKFGTYYSHGQDWNHPGGGNGRWDPLHQTDTFANYLRKVCYPHCRELLDRYRPDIFWWDSSLYIWDEPWMHEEMYRIFHPHLGRIILNNRWQDSFRRRQFESVALYAEARDLDHFRNGDHASPECHFPKTVPPAGLDWESCTSIKWHWGYHATDPRFQSAPYIVRSLVHCASQSGNMLLNIGPMADGAIPPQSIERLEAVGRWMAVYGESIYGTQGGPFSTVFEGALGAGEDLPQPWSTTIDFTRKDGSLFVHVYELPADRMITIPPLRNPIRGIRLLRDRSVDIPYSMKDGFILATVPASVTPNPIDEVLVVETDGFPERVDPEEVYARIPDETARMVALFEHHRREGNFARAAELAKMLATRDGYRGTMPKTYVEMLLREEGDWPDDDVYAALKNDPTNVWWAIARCEAIGVKNNVFKGRAAKLVQQSLAADRSPDNLRRAAEFQGRQGSWDKAAGLWQEVAAADPAQTVTAAFRTACMYHDAREATRKRLDDALAKAAAPDAKPGHRDDVEKLRAEESKLQQQRSSAWERVLATAAPTSKEAARARQELSR